MKSVSSVVALFLLLGCAPYVTTKCQLGQVASAYCRHNRTPCNWAHEVKFPTPFEFTPTVFASLAGIDARSDRNLRLQAVVSKVTQAGFTLTFHIWSNTHVYHAMGTWIACDDQ
ncbi:uncharacterized protein LOC106170198 [Lingula anatina]|uniref:Uncharacterized protein LOC106170198 n=1 Tax=Lingula anatina TaxID=7574 RepID=A0A1S3J6F5_LINAN|nr:uncharacterized protein LOC106170198 [Lingula anatina]|eukprot:XP_013405424.1 uncharacterized protein LOC106170198 [Lingula anatina]